MTVGEVKPTMEFTIGGETRTATYAPDNRPWSLVMKFTYTVQEGDGGVIAIGADGVKMPAGAYVRDVHDNLATSLPHPASNAPGHSVPGAYIVDRKLAITSTPAEGDTYRAGETVTISVKFNSNVTVTGTPGIGLVVDGSRNGHPSAVYSSGSGTDTLTFDYVVASGITAGRGIETDSFELDGGAAIKDADGTDAYLDHDPLGPQPGHKVDGR